MSKMTAKDVVMELHSRMNQFFTEEKHCDTTVQVRNGVLFKCHRLALAATSEFFDLKFQELSRENKNQTVFVLDDIDAETFLEILRYAYTGNIQITDASLQSIVMASNTLKINRVQEFCVAYILRKTDRAIPRILEIFVYACSMKKSILIDSTSRHIMEHFREFDNDDEFLKLPLECLQAFLNQHWFSPPDNEEMLVRTIVKWVIREPETRRKYCAQLLTKVDFHFVSATCVEEVRTDLALNQLAGTSSQQHPTGGIEWDYSPRSRQPKSDLHVFIHEDVYNNAGVIGTTIHSTNRAVATWSSVLMQRFYQYSRAVTLGDQIYCLHFTNDGNRFRKCSSVQAVISSDSLPTESSSDYQCLISPPLISNAFDMCSTPGGDRVYMNDNSEGVTTRNPGYPKTMARFSDAQLLNGIFWFTPLLNAWLPVPLLPEKSCHSTLVNSVSRLYLIGGMMNGDSTCLHALDQRTDRWLRLANGVYPHVSSSCCLYDEKIYACHDSIVEGKPVVVEMYDPVAGKWDKINPMRELCDCIHLMVYENWMWAFGKHRDKEYENYVVETYNSSTRLWSPSPVAGTLSARKTNSFMDALVFKSIIDE